MCFIRAGYEGRNIILRRVKALLYLGPKPPPVSGYANVVVELHKCLVAENIPVRFVPTLPSFLAFLFPGVAWRVCRTLYLAALLPICAPMIPFSRGTYQSLNGGLGLLFDLVCAGLARICGKSVYLHHHSFSYLHRRSALAALVFSAAGERAMHVVNCDAMKSRLHKLYPVVRRVSVVSNVGILAQGDPSKFQPAETADPGGEAEFDGKEGQRPLKLGFMAYFNREKGLDTFCEVVKTLRDQGAPVVGVAVGPVHDAELTARLTSEFTGVVEFRPPAYGKDRDAFFNEIDVLLFPSRYPNEAEPLTIYHSLAAGVPVVATDMGCLRNMLAGASCSAALPCADFARRAIDHIGASLPQLMARKACRASVSADFYETIERNRQNLRDFLSFIRQSDQQ